jgi:hypothetical protein
MYPSQTIVVSIRCPWRQVYEFLAEPLNLPTWVSYLDGIAHVRDNDWRSETEDGPVTLRFTPRNQHGVLDLGVMREGVPAMTLPARVSPNGDDGAELVCTLFHSPDSTDDEFRSETAWIEADLMALKSLLEAA